MRQKGTKWYRGKQRRKFRLGPVQQKILLLLLGGLAISCSRSPQKSWNIIKGINETWKDINRQAAERAVNALYESKLLHARENSDGTTTLLLSEGGKKRALTYHARNMEIPQPPTWDEKWRVVIFDIPEDEREARDAMRGHLERMGCRILQRSVFVHPFDCRDQIEFLIELLGIRKYVRFLIVQSIDNEADLRRVFRVPLKLP